MTNVWTPAATTRCIHFRWKIFGTQIFFFVFLFCSSVQNKAYLCCSILDRPWGGAVVWKPVLRQVQTPMRLREQKVFWWWTYSIDDRSTTSWSWVPGVFAKDLCKQWVVDTGLRQNKCLHSGLFQKPQAPVEYNHNKELEWTPSPWLQWHLTMTGLERQSHSSVCLSEVMLDVCGVCVCGVLCDHGWGNCWIAVL